MNRKNTILIAVLINAGLLTLLLAVAVTTGESPQKTHSEFVQKELELPKFDDAPLYQEIPAIAAVVEPPKKEEEPAQIVHKLPELTCENQETKQIVEKPKALPTLKAPTSPKNDEIVVKKGDNLEKLARAHQTTVDEIIKLNRLPSSFLKIGQVLKIPASRTLAKAKVKEEVGPEYYTIKVGENPWAIALRHKMKLDELLRLNGLNEEKARKLRPGDRLRIR